MDDETKINMLKYQLAMQERSVVNELFWKRSNYFMIVDGALFSSFLISEPGLDPLIKLFVVLGGVIVSTLWMCANFGSKYYQETWEERVRGLDMKLGGYQLFCGEMDKLVIDRIERERRPESTIMKTFILANVSITTLMVCLSFLSIVAWWVLLFTRTKGMNPDRILLGKCLGALIPTMTMLWYFCKGRDKFRDNKIDKLKRQRA